MCVHVLNYQVFTEETLLVLFTILSHCTCTKGKQRSEAEVIEHINVCTSMFPLVIKIVVVFYHPSLYQVEEVIKDRTPCIFGRSCSEKNLLLTDIMAVI